VVTTIRQAEDEAVEDGFDATTDTATERPDRGGTQKDALCRNDRSAADRVADQGVIRARV